MAYQLLFVDDSATMHRVMQITFAREDFVVTTVSNGEQALAKLREARFDLALVDIGMPGMNGYQVCTALRAEPAGAQLQILLFSSPQTPFDETQGQSCGALGHVAKPFEAQALVDRVKVLVGAPTTRPAVASAPAPASAAAIVAVAPTPVFVPTATAAAAPAVGIPLPGRAAPTPASGSWGLPTDSPALPHPPLAPPPRPPQIPTVAVVAAAPAAPSTPPPSFTVPTAAASVPLHQPMPAVPALPVAAPSAVPLGAAWAAAAPVAPVAPIATSSTPAALPSIATPIAVAAAVTAARPPVPAPVVAPIAAPAAAHTAAAPTTPASGRPAADVDQASLHDLLERIAWDVIADVSAQYTLVKR